MSIQYLLLVKVVDINYHKGNGYTKRTLKDF